MAGHVIPGGMECRLVQGPGDNAARQSVSHQPGRGLHSGRSAGSTGRADRARLHNTRSGRRAITTKARIDHKQPVGRGVARVSGLDPLDRRSRQAGPVGEHPGQHPDFGYDPETGAGMRRRGGPGLDHHLGSDAGGITAGQQEDRLFGRWHQCARRRAYGPVMWLDRPLQPTMKQCRDARFVAPLGSSPHRQRSPDRTGKDQSWIACSHGWHSSR